MKQNPTRPLMARWFEVIFDALYLLAAVCFGVIMLLRNTGIAGQLSGVMALVLAVGDAFHLVPRIITAVSGDRKRMNNLLGFGKMITSITMTLFYVLLWHIGLLFFAPESAHTWTILVYILALSRIALCFFRQNGWTSAVPSVRWAIYRNIPFLLLGAMTAILFGIYFHVSEPLRYMWLAITLSFLFYIPVVVWAQKNPKLGMLMIPKTCMYIWMLAMCLAL